MNLTLTDDQALVLLRAVNIALHETMMRKQLIADRVLATSDPFDREFDNELALQYSFECEQLVQVKARLMGWYTEGEANI